MIPGRIATYLEMVQPAHVGSTEAGGHHLTWHTAGADMHPDVGTSRSPHNDGCPDVQSGGIPCSPCSPRPGSGDEVVPLTRSPVPRAAHSREGSVCEVALGPSVEGSVHGEAVAVEQLYQVLVVEELYEVLKARAAPGDVILFNPRSLAFSWRGVEPKLNAWFPDRFDFWRAEGRVIAWRNLIVSQLNLTVCFAVWLMWSIIVLRIQRVHDIDPTKFAFGFSSNEERRYQSRLYMLPAFAGLSGGTFRISNSFLILPIGGRTVISLTTMLLILPCALAAWELSRDDPSLLTLSAAALLSGIGGGAFASSMSNISYFFPGRTSGLALGIHGGLGNVGISLTQILIPLIIAGVGAIGTSLGGDQAQAEGMEVIDGAVHEKVWVGAIFWIPICFVFSITASLWLNDMPHHGNASFSRRIWYYFCMQGASVAAAAITSYIIFAIDELVAIKSNSAQLGFIFVVVLVATILAHGICSALRLCASVPVINPKPQTLNRPSPRYPLFHAPVCQCACVCVLKGGVESKVALGF